MAQRRKRLRINWNGKKPLPLRRVALRRAIRRAQRGHLVVTSTSGGTHAPTSYHFVEKAVDLASWSRPDMVRFQRAEYMRSEDRRKRTGRPLWTELFGPDNNLCISRGKPVTLAEHSALEDLHDTHVHLARA